IDKTRPPEMQPVWRPPTIRDQIIPNLTIPALNRLINLTRRDFRLTHHDLEMPDQRFHLGVNVFLRRQIISRRIGMINLRLGTRHILYLPVGLLDDAQRLPHLTLPYQEPVVTVTG